MKIEEKVIFQTYIFIFRNKFYNNEKLEKNVLCVDRAELHVTR